MDLMLYIGSNILLDLQAKKLFTSPNQEARTTKYKENLKFRENKEKAQKPQNTSRGKLPNDSSQSTKKPRAGTYESRSVTGLPQSKAVGMRWGGVRVEVGMMK